MNNVLEMFQFGCIETNVMTPRLLFTVLTRHRRRGTEKKTHWTCCNNRSTVSLFTGGRDYFASVRARAKGCKPAASRGSFITSLERFPRKNKETNTQKNQQKRASCTNMVFTTCRVHPLTPDRPVRDQWEHPKKR